MRLVTVLAAALIDSEQRILLAQRPEGKSMAGLWEFPGGKLEAGETPEACLIRELQEELGITTSIENLHAITFVSHAYADFHLLMLLYGCRDWSGEMIQHEHQALEWVTPQTLTDYPMPAADIPLIQPLRDWVRQGIAKA